MGHHLGDLVHERYTVDVTKQDLIALIEALPDDTEEELSYVANEIERLLIERKIRTGLSEIERGEGHTQQDIEDSIATWADELS